MGRNTAEFDADSAQTIRTDIWKALATNFICSRYISIQPWPIHLSWKLELIEVGPTTIQVSVPMFSQAISFAPGVLAYGLGQAISLGNSQMLAQPTYRFQFLCSAKPSHLLQVYQHIALAKSSLLATHRCWPNQHIGFSSYVQPSHLVCSQCISIQPWPSHLSWQLIDVGPTNIQAAVSVSSQAISFGPGILIYSLGQVICLGQ